jgi:rSAM/selenodomain-associated transferase 1
MMIPANTGASCTLVVMAKAPRPGNVKTRLAQNLPVLEVTELYRCLLADTIALGKSLAGVEVALMCPGADVADLIHATNNSVPIIPQTGSGLAAGLTSVFAHFSTGGGNRIVAFNSDTPHLPASFLESAFHALISSDVVIGPTHDGGYYLIGAKASHPELFIADAMGTINAYDALLARVRALNLSLSIIEPFYDVDEVADLHQLAAELLRDPKKAPRTAAWILAREQKSKTAPSGGAP